MNLTLTSEDVNEPTKIKAINPHIIVGGSAEQPYYSIEYYDVEKEQFYIGYSSCYLSTVFKWLNECFDVVAGDADVIIRNLKADKEALIAGQETLQKALAEKDKEIEKLKDEAFREGLNENRSLFAKEVIQEIQQVICENTYPGADSSGKAVMIWKARTGYDAVKDVVLKAVGDTE